MVHGFAVVSLALTDRPVCDAFAPQGIVGSTPWNAMVFFTLYLQLLGMSDFAASLLMAVFLGGTAVGEAKFRDLYGFRDIK